MAAIPTIGNTLGYNQGYATGWCVGRHTGAVAVLHALSTRQYEGAINLLRGKVRNADASVKALTDHGSGGRKGYDHGELEGAIKGKANMIIEIIGEISKMPGEIQRLRYVKLAEAEARNIMLAKLRETEHGD
jgi:hypothetical protein